MNFVRTGGRFGRDEPVATLAARTNYFREEYAYGQQSLIDGIEPYLNHEGFVEAARAIHGRRIVEPAIVFANLMVPGQELAVHTDVPEFRGCNRKVMPQWLLVAMHHSGLFETHRMPIATGVAWYHDCDGGEFVYWPDGAAAPPTAHKVRFDTALVLDADSVFHGVDRIADARGRAAAAQAGHGPRADRRRPLGVRSTTSPNTTGTSCASACRGRRTASRTSTSSARGASTPTTSRSPWWSTASWPTCATAAVSRVPLPGTRSSPSLIIDEYIRFPPPNGGD